ncbi:MAG: hypothetical protein IT325_00975 [Anaerolineae bacterium]|nr:hypothetical protein [Anaerolineae bacterium]
MTINDDKNRPITAPRKRKLTDQRVPGINLRELITERNWTALAGLGLLAIGVLYVVDSWLGLDFELWSLLLIVLGGWLLLDGWRDYEAAGRTWESRARNRVFAGVMVAALGLFGLFELNTWSWLLIILAGWLAYDTWQRYETTGRVVTQTVRNRFIGAGIMAALGLLGALNWWSAWPLLLIALGLALLTGVIGERSR